MIFVSSGSARTLKCPSSARQLPSSGSLEPENSSSNPSLADFQWQFDVLTLKVILEHAVFECTMGPRHSEIEFRLLKFIYSEKALLSNNYIFANFGIKPTLIWYCLVGQTVYLSSFKHLSSKHCNLFYWKLICESITDPDLLWICFVSGWFRKCNWKEHRSGL